MSPLRHRLRGNRVIYLRDGSVVGEYSPAAVNEPEQLIEIGLMPCADAVCEDKQRTVVLHAVEIAPEGVPAGGELHILARVAVSVILV